MLVQVGLHALEFIIHRPEGWAGIRRKCIVMCDLVELRKGLPGTLVLVFHPPYRVAC